MEDPLGDFKALKGKTESHEEQLGLECPSNLIPVRGNPKTGQNLCTTSGTLSETLNPKPQQTHTALQSLSLLATASFFFSSGGGCAFGSALGWGSELRAFRAQGLGLRILGLGFGAWKPSQKSL